MVNRSWPSHIPTRVTEFNTVIRISLQDECDMTCSPVNRHDGWPHERQVLKLRRNVPGGPQRGSG